MFRVGIIWTLLMLWLGVSAFHLQGCATSTKWGSRLPSSSWMARWDVIQLWTVHYQLLPRCVSVREALTKLLHITNFSSFHHCNSHRMYRHQWPCGRKLYLLRQFGRHRHYRGRVYGRTGVLERIWFQLGWELCLLCQFISHCIGNWNLHEWCVGWSHMVRMSEDLQRHRGRALLLMKMRAWKPDAGAEGLAWPNYISWSLFGSAVLCLGCARPLKKTSAQVVIYFSVS